MIRAGHLRHRVSLERWESVPDPRWGAGGGWVTFGNVWVGIEPRGGSEVTDAKSQQTQVTHDVVMRYRADVDSKVRLRWGCRVFEIVSVLDVGERKRELKIEAVERPENG